jgi:colanic acid biosynthesis glycosyl transferase WcaI
MRVLILAHHFSPEEVSGAVLATELAAGLLDAGHEVRVVTAAPSYPAGRVFAGHKNSLFSRVVQCDVLVDRVWSHITPSRRIGARISNNVTFCALAVLAGWRGPRPDVIFCYSPPLPLGLAGYVIARRWRIPWMLRIEDLFPDAAVAAGVLRVGRIADTLQRIARLAAKEASGVSVIQQSIAARLAKIGIEPGKISVTPVWSDTSAIQPGPKANSVAGALGIEATFNVVYSGTIGYTSGLSDLIGAAALLRGDSSVRVIVVGDGVRRPELERQVRELALNNVQFSPFLPRVDYPLLLAASDVGIVTINPASAPFSLPSKLFNIMAAGRAVIAIAPRDSDVARLVEATGCGVVVQPGQPGEAAEWIRRMDRDRSLPCAFGQRGREHAVRSFSREACIGRLEAELRALVGRWT